MTETPAARVPVSESAIVTIPNLISVARLCCVPWFLWLLFGQEDRVAAAVLLMVLGATDWVDGYVARRFGYGGWPSESTELRRVSRCVKHRRGIDAAMDLSSLMKLGQRLGQTGGIWQEIVAIHRNAGRHPIRQRHPARPLQHGIGNVVVHVGCIDIDQVGVADGRGSPNTAQEAVAARGARRGIQLPNQNRTIEYCVGRQELFDVVVATGPYLGAIALGEHRLRLRGLVAEDM